ncbi:hypothetical protein SAMN05444352_115158 [Pseudomonas japonica]|uniref:Immunity protein 49 n=2 Tax=Pseudomonas japonica TaxID=256466 RepID=A0A239HKT3_9PSED|nr:hypothetical protein SAMN05444352_115158 [Pseudomonas japonica]
MLEFSKSLLEAQAHRMEYAKQHMAFGFKRQLLYDLTELMGKRGSSDRIIGDLDTVTHTLLGVIATGNNSLVEPFYNVVLSSVTGAYGVFDGHNPPSGSSLRYAAFGLSIISDWLGTPLDLDAHALPRDPAWGQLVAHWREPDPDKFLSVLLQACDTHVERIAVTEREANALSKDFEFNSVFLAVHPTEILAVLRLRDLLGLPNPVEINHPLMQTPYAAITCRPGEITERDELLERYLATVRQRDPHVLPPELS